MLEDYSLGSDLMPVSGGSILDKFVKNTVGYNQYITLAVIVVLVLIILWLLWTDSFSPTRLSRNQVVALNENMENGRHDDYVYGQVRGYQMGVDVDCDKVAQMNQDNAWGWVYGKNGGLQRDATGAPAGGSAYTWLPSEGMRGKTEDTLSAVLAGH